MPTLPWWGWLLLVVAFANIGALIFAFLRFRASRDLPPPIAQPVESSLHDDGVTPAARLRDLERELQGIQRAFNDLHTTVETRHRSLSGLISKKLGGRAAREEADDDDEPPTVPKSAFAKLAELEAAAVPPPTPPVNGARRHLRRY